MPQLILKRSNLLAYPGTMPGFDPSHPASKNALMSVIPFGSNFFDFVQNKAFTLTGATPNPVAVKSSLGQVIAFDGTANQTLSLVTGVATPAALTVAGIFYLSVSVVVALSGLGGNGVYFGFYFLTTYALGTGSNGWPVGLALNTPYFCVYSMISGTGTPYNIYIKNLLTGQIQTIVGATSGPATLNLGTIYVGNDYYGDYSSGGIAASMASQTYLTMPQIMAWGEDPWSFWYPQKIDLSNLLSIIPVAATAPLAPALLKARNKPGLGPQSRHVALLNAGLPIQVVTPPVTAGTLPFMGVG